MNRFFWLAFPLGLAAGCQLVAGLGDATPLTEASASASGPGSTGTGGNGGASISSSANVTSAAAGGAGGLSSSDGSGGSSASASSGGAGGGICSNPPGLIEAVAAGAHHSCAAVSGAFPSVYCWGDNAHLQLGIGTTAGPVSTPSIVGASFANMSTIALAANGDFTCAALRSGNSVTCWGSNADGQAGPNKPATDLVPTTFTLTGTSGTVDALYAGVTFACAKTSTGDLACWGTINGVKQAPSLIASGVSFGAAGAHHFCYVGASTSVKCFGANDQDQCGASSSSTPTVDPETPVVVAGTTGGMASALAAGADVSCAELGVSWACWGANHGDILDLTGAVMSSTTPKAIPMPLSGVHGAAGVDFACVASDFDGTVGCWGDDTNGQLGIASGNQSSLDFAATGIAIGYSTVTPTDEHTCVCSDSSIKCWGSNGHGECGVDNSSTVLFDKDLCW